MTMVEQLQRSIWNSLQKPIKILAPMEDVTDAAFRQLLVEFGRPDLFFTEFINCEGFCSAGRKAVEHRLRYTAQQRPIIAQIWGNDPKSYEQLAFQLRQCGFDGIDINLGCSVPKVLKNRTCAALIKEPDLVRELYLATCQGADTLPVSFKTRIGFDQIQTSEWIGYLLSLKPAAITIHGRIAKQQLKGQANWEEIRKAVVLRDSLSPCTRIIGNGDVHDQVDLQTKAELSGVDGVMVGRAVISNPFFFATAPRNRTLKDSCRDKKIELLLRHYQIFQETWGATKSLKVMNKFIRPYLSGFSGAAELRKLIIEADSFIKITTALEDALR